MHAWTICQPVCRHFKSESHCQDCQGNLIFGTCMEMLCAVLCQDLMILPMKLETTLLWPSLFLHYRESCLLLCVSRSLSLVLDEVWNIGQYDSWGLKLRHLDVPCFPTLSHFRRGAISHSSNTGSTCVNLVCYSLCLGHWVWSYRWGMECWPVKNHLAGQ